MSISYKLYKSNLRFEIRFIWRRRRRVVLKWGVFFWWREKWLVVVVLLIDFRVFWRFVVYRVGWWWRRRWVYRVVVGGIWFVFEVVIYGWGFVEKRWCLRLVMKKKKKEEEVLKGDEMLFGYKDMCIFFFVLILLFNNFLFKNIYV